MPKERLDLMVDGKVKEMLRNVAATEGMSMSQLVEVMLMEHLSEDKDAIGPMHAVSDLLWIQRLQEKFNAAMKLGRVYSFRAWSSLVEQGQYSKADESQAVIYVGKGERGSREGDFVIDWFMDGGRAEILSTYDDVLKTVGVRIEWTDAEDGSFIPYGFRVWPDEGSAPHESLFEWECPTPWADAKNDLDN